MRSANQYVESTCQSNRPKISSAAQNKHPFDGILAVLHSFIPVCIDTHGIGSISLSRVSRFGGNLGAVPPILREGGEHDEDPLCQHQRATGMDPIHSRGS